MKPLGTQSVPNDILGHWIIFFEIFKLLKYWTFRFTKMGCFYPFWPYRRKCSRTTISIKILFWTICSFHLPLHFFISNQVIIRWGVSSTVYDGRALSGDCRSPRNVSFRWQWDPHLLPSQRLASLRPPRLLLPLILGQHPLLPLLHLLPTRPF